MTSASRAPFPAAKYIKEIGRGVNGARALPREDAQALFDAMLAGRVSDLELGAVLLAYRIKGEAPHELAGMLDAAHDHCAPLAAPADKPVVVIPSYNGARKQPNLVPLLAMLLARDGVPTLVHGIREFPGRVTSMALFEALGVPLCATAQSAEAQLGAASNPLAALPIDVLSPALSQLLDKRAIIGLRNSAHTVVKMLQPVGGHSRRGIAALQLHPPRISGNADRVFLARTRQRDAGPGYRGEVVADARRSSRIDWLHDGHQRTMVDPVGGSVADVPELPQGTDIAETAAWIRKVLDGAEPVPAPVATQVAAIKECLTQATRVTWASPL
jgi:anthranilate phosphoribosyltransferase